MSKGDWSWIPEEAKNRWGYTVAELAGWLGVKRQVVDNWVRGRNDPDIINFYKLARMVGSVEELARRSGIEVEFSPPGIVQFDPPITPAQDRNYEHLRTVVEWMKYTSRFRDLYEHSYSQLRDISGKDDLYTAQLNYNLAYSELMLGRPRDAIESITIARKLISPKKDSLLLADTHWFEGECLRVTNRLNDAQFHLMKARKIYKRLNAKPSFQFSGPLWLEWDFGRIFAAYGQYDKAANHFARMEQMARGIWLAEGEIVAGWSNGDIDETRSNFRGAFAAYLDARELANQMGDKFWEAMALWRMAEVYRKTSSFVDALQVSRAARHIFEEIGNARMAAKVDCTIASCYLMNGLFSDAQALYHNAIEIFEKSEDTPMQHICLLGLSYIRLFEESQKPDPNFKEVLAVFVDIDASRPESYELHQEVTEELALAEALRLSGYLSQALSRYQSVKDTSTRYGYRLEKAHALIGIAATKAMNTEVDRESCNKALEIYGAVGSKWGEVQALITRAIMEFGIGGSGSEYLREASRIKEEISLAPQGKLIEELSKIGFDARERYVFLFV